MIDVDIALPGAPAGLAAIIQRAAAAALAHEGRSGDMTFAVVDDEAIHALNRTYRHVDRPTDVLSFPAWEGEAMPGGEGYLGDIAISLPTALRQAAQYGHSLEREIAFLALHGTLHLLGYDHMSPRDEREMFALQDAILKEMEITR